MILVAGKYEDSLIPSSPYLLLQRQRENENLQDKRYKEGKFNFIQNGRFQKKKLGAEDMNFPGVLKVAWVPVVN